MKYLQYSHKFGVISQPSFCTDYEISKVHYTACPFTSIWLRFAPTFKLFLFTRQKFCHPAKK